MAAFTAYSVPGVSFHTYQVGGYINVNSFSMGASVGLVISFHDENNVSQTLNMFPTGSTTSAVNTTGFFPYQSTTIRAKSGTTVTVSSGVGGTINFDFGGFIQQIN